MKRAIRLLLCLMVGADAMLLPRPAVGAPPPNDMCSMPTTLNLNTPANGTNFDATADVLQTCSDLDSFDVWYRFTAPATGGYTFSTLGSVLDTTLSLWTQCSGGIMITCNDDIDPDTGITESQILGFSMAAGQVVLVRVAGAVEAEGTFVLRVMPAAAVPGICCTGSTCAVGTLPSECVGVFQHYVSMTSACNAGGNTTNPCCLANFNKVGGITVQDVFDFLAAWFAGNPIANITDNGAGVPTIQSIFDFIDAWFTGGCT